MKVLQVINSLGAGGAERSLVEMLPAFRDLGIDTTIVCVQRRNDGVESEVAPLGVPVRYLEGHRLPVWVRNFRRLLASERPDLIQTTLFDSHVVGRVGAAGTRIPVLSSLVGLPYDPIRSHDPNLNHRAFRLVRLIDGWTARHLTTHFHAITHAVREAYIATLRLDPGRITVVERGRSLQRLGTPGQARRRAVRARLGIPDDRPLLVSVGRQEFQKGHEFLLRAMPAILRDHPRVLLVHLGRVGQTTRTLQRLRAELRLDEHVTLLGHRNDVADVLAAADIFVFPSLSEGLGGAVLEAMALGLPVVATDIAALREIVEHGRSGLLVPRASPDAIAQAVCHLLIDADARAAFGARGQAVFRQRFEIDRSVRRMVELYRQVTLPSSDERQCSTTSVLDTP